ncbi:transport and Golgi organization protein 2 isoform X1 [Lucilia sericata]|uniref:transport and Golgi organization protein 2 isoform X1 n=1 Tax=Lucilia sericata TaxID=13632 RepID=UPI0018A831B3|nr:transport and Golgi organization protein 2 isoform X1 [Lucilia sericata]XP_037816800.1 transport and Golgi organization protein 2 isoform X1 [Lucilia sericata]
MCVIFFYVNSNPNKEGYKLILASNRDEFYARDTKQAGKWLDAEHVYGGIDLEPGREGGTWLAISGKDDIIKVGALLNLTGEPKPKNAEVMNHIENYHQHHNHHLHENHNCNNKTSLLTTTTNGYSPSKNTTAKISNNTSIDMNNPTSTPIHNNNSLLGRGMIVSDYVRNYSKDFDNTNYNQKLVNDCSKYSAFNFVSIEIGSPSTPAAVTLCSNVPAGLVHYKENTCYGFGNSLPSVPFEKVCYGRDTFQHILDDFQQQKNPHQDELVEKLMNLLKCKKKFWPDAELKRRAPIYGEHLSALNVLIPETGYGSRTHTVILVDNNNKMHFIEETMLSENPEGEWSRTHIEKQF